MHDHLGWAGVKVFPTPSSLPLHWKGRLSGIIIKSGDAPYPAGRARLYSWLASNAVLRCALTLMLTKQPTYTDRRSFRLGVEDQLLFRCIIYCDSDRSWLDNLWLTAFWWFCQHQPRSLHPSLFHLVALPSYSSEWHRQLTWQIYILSSNTFFFFKISTLAWLTLSACMSASQPITLKARAAEDKEKYKNSSIEEQ